MVITQLHDNHAVALEKRPDLDNHGSYDNETSRQYASYLYKHNRTVELAQQQLQNAQRQAATNNGHCRHRRSMLCCVSSGNFSRCTLLYRAISRTASFLPFFGFFDFSGFCFCPIPIGPVLNPTGTQT